MMHKRFIFGVPSDILKTSLLRERVLSNVIALVKYDTAVVPANDGK